MDSSQNEPTTFEEPNDPAGPVQENEGEMSFQTSITQIDVPPVPPHAKKRRGKKIFTPTTSSVADVISYLERKEINKGTTPDEVDKLFLAHAMTMKKFSPRRQAITKLKFAELMAEQELLHLEEIEASTLSTYSTRSTPTTLESAYSRHDSDASLTGGEYQLTQLDDTSSVSTFAQVFRPIN